MIHPHDLTISVLPFGNTRLISGQSEGVFQVLVSPDVMTGAHGPRIPRQIVGHIVQWGALVDGRTAALEVITAGVYVNQLHPVRSRGQVGQPKE